MTTVAGGVRTFVAESLLRRNPISRALFDREADRLARAAEEMAGRFLRGGRLLAFGAGAAATDAQHVSVEFVHPVIVGKRALPALDLSSAFESAVPALTRDADIAMGFGGGDAAPAVQGALERAAARGAYTCALPGSPADFALESPSADPFIAQEMIEIVYHTLWETVHVFLERRRRGHDDVGASAFLYPFLGEARQDTSSIRREVAESIRAKAMDDERLRADIASAGLEAVTTAVEGVLRRIDAGATLLIFGNGGSATDANDWALDCTAVGAGRPVPAVSLCAEPATISAIANDIGAEAIFLRQLIAHGRAGDVAIAVSTSGGSANVLAALEEARKRRMLTVALLGYDGGEILRRGLADAAVVVGCDYIPRIQEVQASIYHVLTEAWRRWRT
jgi:D-sedoheptulose 7-phosphate isomerase